MEKSTLLSADLKKSDASTKLNNKVLKNIQITSQENMIIKSLEKFYEDDKNVEIFLDIINLESIMSIRLIDYFVTKYSKNNKVCYKISDNDNTLSKKSDQLFNVYSSYKQQLKAYQKKHFDPFSRGDRIPYFVKDTCIITTIGQLNFFKWLISKNIYCYIKLNYDIIQNDMNKKKNKKQQILKPKKITKYQNIYVQQNIKQIKNNNIIKPVETKKDKIIVSFCF